jgi:hypothetical protein
MNLFTQDQYTIAEATINGPLAQLVTSTTCTAPDAVEEYLFTTSVTIFPNPSSGKFTVSINLTNFTHVNLEVLNVLGQTVATWNSDKQTNNSYALDLSSQPNGLYFVKITNGTYSTVKKIMVSR